MRSDKIITTGQLSQKKLSDNEQVLLGKYEISDQLYSLRSGSKSIHQE